MRKTKDVVIGPDGGRDAHKIFVLTEMPSWQAEEWAIRALTVIAKSGVNIPEEVMGAGFAGIAFLGVQALPSISFSDIQPLMAEMFQCIQIRPNMAAPAFVRPLIDNGTGDDIEEVKTRLLLRKEVLDLHMGFSAAAAPSESKLETTATSTLKTAQTSPAPSPKPSRLTKQRS